MKCKHCKYPNKEGWFYCSSCGKKANESKFTTNMYMGSDVGKRSDIEFSVVDSDTHVKNLEKQRQAKQNKYWKEKINAIR